MAFGPGILGVLGDESALKAMWSVWGFFFPSFFPCFSLFEMFFLSFFCLCKISCMFSFLKKSLFFFEEKKIEPNEVLVSRQVFF